MAYNFYNADPESPRFFASNNMAVPADLFAAIGGFLGGTFRVASEDRELCDRWQHAGHALPMRRMPSSSTPMTSG